MATASEQVYLLQQDAYRKVVRCLMLQNYDLKKELLMADLRKHFNISDEMHSAIKEAMVSDGRNALEAAQLHLPSNGYRSSGMQPSMYNHQRLETSGGLGGYQQTPQLGKMDFSALPSHGYPAVSGTGPAGGAYPTMGSQRGQQQALAGGQLRGPGMGSAGAAQQAMHPQQQQGMGRSGQDSVPGTSGGMYAAQLVQQQQARQAAAAQQASQQRYAGTAQSSGRQQPGANAHPSSHMAPQHPERHPQHQQQQLYRGTGPGDAAAPGMGRGPPGAQVGGGMGSGGRVEGSRGVSSSGRLEANGLPQHYGDTSRGNQSQLARAVGSALASAPPSKPSSAHGGGGGPPKRASPTNTAAKPAKKRKGDVVPPRNGTEKAAAAPLAIAPPDIQIDELIGRKVSRFWPDYGGWFEGVITDFRPASGEHCITYSINNADESFEWYNVRDPANRSECRMLEGGVNVLEIVKPAGAVAAAAAQPSQAYADPAKSNNPKKARANSGSIAGRGARPSQQAVGYGNMGSRPQPQEVYRPQVSPLSSSSPSDSSSAGDSFS